MTPSLRDRAAARRSSHRILALTLALAALTAGCVRQAGPGVKVNALDAELVFGVKEQTESAPTPPEAPVLPPQAPFDGFTLSANSFDIPLPSEPEDDGICHDEIMQSTPDRDADVVVTGHAANGKYEYKGAYVEHIPVSPQTNPPTFTQKVSPLPIEVREIRNYKVTQRPENVTPPGQKVRMINYITYDYIQPFGTNFLKTSFQVKLGAETVSASTPKGTLENPVTGAPPRVNSDPEAGVALMGTELINAAGQRVPGSEAFSPSNGILMLPLPVQSEQITSSGTDPDTGKTFVNQANVLARERVNACGDPVDGWLVEAFIAISDENDPSGGTNKQENQYRWNYIIAPQYGGLIVGEEIKRDHDRETPKRNSESVIRTINNIEPK